MRGEARAGGVFVDGTGGGGAIGQGRVGVGVGAGGGALAWACGGGGSVLWVVGVQRAVEETKRLLFH
jgi:hypothetical protein